MFREKLTKIVNIKEKTKHKIQENICKLQHQASTNIQNKELFKKIKRQSNRKKGKM